MRVRDRIRRVRAGRARRQETRLAGPRHTGRWLRWISVQRSFGVPERQVAGLKYQRLVPAVQHVLGASSPYAIATCLRSSPRSTPGFRRRRSSSRSRHELCLRPAVLPGTDTVGRVGTGIAWTPSRRSRSVVVHRPGLRTAAGRKRLLACRSLAKTSVGMSKSGVTIARWPFMNL